VSRDTDAIEGRWWLDFTKHPPRDPSGNEFILSAGTVSIAKTGDPAGGYHIAPGVLTMTLPMPAIPDEGPWRMEARFLLIHPERPVARLDGIIRAIGSNGDVMLNDACALVRMSADA
jgi:hypothetical protein